MPRCAFATCHKRLAPTDECMGTCRCGGCFCTSHRLPEDHVCTYDFAVRFKEQHGSNAVYVPPKVRNIAM